MTFTEPFLILKSKSDRIGKRKISNERLFKTKGIKGASLSVNQGFGLLFNKHEHGTMGLNPFYEGEEKADEGD